ncbi:amino acid ABC transporter permease [Shinella sp. CPCC 101442]|uniref:amino acid ABC transporter permease n=1 Tax=Shinella sp. CPCC 101442 TaxID=2932265 RepID=UPI002152EF7E|nr:amino acid ABC transporter permease [Shinella sp. CPCC 101442]MCR6497420.1 amino acid ABC transporter permease [Shinella sp. CPCC 101442]
MQYNFDLGVIFQEQYFSLLVSGFSTTIMLTLTSLLLAFLVGSLLTGLRLTGCRSADVFVALYVAFHRNVPMVVHILFWYFGVAALLPATMTDWLYSHNAEFLMAMIAIGLVGSAYISEDLRSAVRSIPAGQTEAARALGLNYVRTLRRIILPQAFRIAIPPLVNQTVLMFKNTSLAMAIGVLELTAAGREIENYTFKTFEIYVVITAFYLVFSLFIMWGGGVLASRYAAVVRDYVAPVKAG